MKICKQEGCKAVVFSNGYCRSHQYLRDNLKVWKFEKKPKSKEIQKIIDKTVLLFEEIWQERKHNCQSCGKYLGNTYTAINFDHLIPKSKRKDLTLEKDNILLVCADCHWIKENGLATAKHRKYIEKAKLKYEN